MAIVLALLFYILGIYFAWIKVNQEEPYVAEKDILTPEQLKNYILGIRILTASLSWLTVIYFIQRDWK